MNDRLPANERGSQAGSAYIIALMVLVVLSIIGMALALITQTEMQVGANERILQRVFYAADSGLAASTARALVEAEYASRVYELPDADLPGIPMNTEVSPFLPIMSAPCNLCEINEGGQYGREPFHKINYGVTAEAVRHTGGGGQAMKVLSTLVEVQPWQLNPDALEPLDDPEQLAKLRF
jgi:hypothetical protein